MFSHLNFNSDVNKNGPVPNTLPQNLKFAKRYVKFFPAKIHHTKQGD